MWPNPQSDLVSFTEEIVNGKLHFLCSIRHKDFRFPISGLYFFTNFEA